MDMNMGIYMYIHMHIYRNEKLMYMEKAKRESLTNTFIKEVLMMFDDCIMILFAIDNDVNDMSDDSLKG